MEVQPGIEIILGDCLQGLRSMAPGSVDLFLTDPPYGIDYNSNRRKHNALATAEGIANDGEDNIPLLQAVAVEANRVLKDDRHLYWFTRWDKLPQHMELLGGAGFWISNLLVWDKAGKGMGDLEATYANAYECVLFCQKGRRTLRTVMGTSRHTDILRFPRVDAQRLRHSHEKPTSLLEFLIQKSSEPSELVCDPFMGSGSTAQAAYAMGRRFVGWELDPLHFATTQERFGQMRFAIC